MNDPRKTKLALVGLIGAALLFSTYSVYGVVAAPGPSEAEYDEFQSFCENELPERIGDEVVVANRTETPPEGESSDPPIISLWDQSGSDTLNSSGRPQREVREITQEDVEKCKNTTYGEYETLQRQSLLSGAPYSLKIGGIQALIGLTFAGWLTWMYREGEFDE